MLQLQLILCYQTKLVEFVAGEAVQHNVGNHPERNADGEDGSQPNPDLVWNAANEVGDGVPDEFVEGGCFEATTASLKNYDLIKANIFGL